MPITVTTPAQGDFIGPGTIIRAETLSVLPVGHHWDALVFQTGTQDELSTALTLREGQFSEMWLNVTEPTLGARTPVWLPQLAQPVGAETTLTVRVVNAQSTQIIDTSGPIGVVWRPDPAGVAWVQSLGTSTASGGFSEADRTNLNGVLNAVQLVAPLPGGSGLELVSRVIDLVRGPPRSMLTFGTSITLTDRGTLNPSLDGAGRFTYGFQWRYVTVPPGIGYRDGQMLEYIPRMAQFVIQRAGADNQTYVDQLVDTNSDDQVVLWQRPPPINLLYDITHGVAVRLTWLI